MRKRNLALILCMAVILCGCGKSAEIQDREVTIQESEAGEKLPEESSTEEKVPMESEIVKEKVIEPKPDQQEPEEEDGYVIYERFLNGEEPLYFREDVWGWDQNPDAGENAMLEAGKPYGLKEICSMINMYDNSDAVFDEMRQLSYAYIDCGADGDIELALSFDNLVDLRGLDGSEIFIIKNIGGRLEMCHLITTFYRFWGELSNECGVVTEGGSGGASYESETVGYLDADGNYMLLYDKDMEYCGYGTDIYLDDYSQAMEGYDLEYVLVVTKYSFEPLDNYQSYDEYEANMKYSFELYDRTDRGDILVEDMDSSVYESSDYQEILDKAGIPFYSAAEIDDMILDRSGQIGLTEEIRNGNPVQWTSYGERDDDLL